jgi:phosphopantothenoylcysteine decarboxylase/phosphopantothenate--cysteine ligase
MGYALANEFASRGAEVILVSGPVSIDTKLRGVKIIKVTSAEEMILACLSVPEYNIAVMAAAVADYTPSIVSDTKIKKEEGELTITLKKTRDILGEFGRNKKNGQVLVGFALETNNETENALKKLKGKNADIIVLNSLNDKGAGFGHDSNKVKLFFKNGREKDIDLKSKTQVSIDIVDSITELL